MRIVKRIQLVSVVLSLVAMSSQVEAQRGSNRGNGSSEGTARQGGGERGYRSGVGARSRIEGSDRSRSQSNGRSGSEIGSQIQQRIRSIQQGSSSNRDQSGLRIRRDENGGVTIQRGSPNQRGQRGSGINRDQRDLIDGRDQRDRSGNRTQRSYDVGDALNDLGILNNRGGAIIRDRDGRYQFGGRDNSSRRGFDNGSGRPGAIYRGGNPGINIGGRDGVRLSIGQNGLNVSPSRSYLGSRYGGRSGWSHFMPRYGRNYGGAFYRSQNQYYYSPNYYSQSNYSQPYYSQGTFYQEPAIQTTQQSVKIEFGERQFIDELADQLHVLSNELCLDLYENYSENPDFKATYTEAYAIYSFAKYLQEEGDRVSQTQLAEEIQSIDSLFHNVEDVISTWTPQPTKKISELDTETRIAFIEETIHHLMYDIGVPLDEFDEHTESAR